MSRLYLSRALSAVAVCFAYVALVAPRTYDDFNFGSLLRISFEVIALGWLLIALPRRFALALGVVAGTLTGVLLIVKLIDIGFDATWDRPFNPVFDVALVDEGFRSLQASFGDRGATAVVAVGAVMSLAVIALLAASFVRIASLAARHQRLGWRVMGVLSVLWGLVMVANTSAPLLNSADLAYDKTKLVVESLSDKREFDDLMATDAYADTPGSQLLTSLQGKEVVVVFIESYGRSAVDGSGEVSDLLQQESNRLASDGFTIRSGFLTSPVQGGGSWMAHATFAAGVWTDNQRRYDTLVASNRLTLAGAFKKAGWNTIAVAPGNTREWSESHFFGFNEVHNARELGYSGPPIRGWFPIPDQYSLAKLEDIRRARADRTALMTDVTLTSSHGPWAPTPPLLDWGEIDDGSVFNRYGDLLGVEAPPWSDPPKVQAAYQGAVRYSLESILSYVKTFAHDDQLFIILGDHQPATVVTGDNASKDVPISILSRDAGLIDRIDAWGWSDGLRPQRDAPVWRMDAFRDRFLGAFGGP